MLANLLRNVRLNRPISPLSVLFSFSEEWMQRRQRIGLSDVTKPPTVLILSQKQNNTEKWKLLLSDILSEDTYVIYEIKQEEFLKAHWMENVSLLIMDHVTELREVDHNLLDSFICKGGSAFIHCTSYPKIQDRTLDFNESIAREKCFFKDEHQKCFTALIQPSFQTICDNVGSKILCQVNSTGSSVVSLYNKLHGKGIVSALDFISSVYSEKNNELVEVDKIQIKELLKHSIQCLGLSCSVGNNESKNIKLTPGYLEGDSMAVDNFISSLSAQQNKRAQKSNGLQLKIIENEGETEDIDADENVFPIIDNRKNGSESSGFINFNFKEYWRNLQRCSTFGRVVIYSHTVTSTQIILERISALSSLSNGVVVVASQQTQGKGRGGNQWLSPEGCMMLSLAVSIKMSSKLGKRPPFLQHIAAVAFVNAVREMPGYEKLEIGIKWPNDIYFGRNVKIGGLVANSSMSNDEFKAIIGIGMNVSNKRPTVCLNGIIEEFNMKNNTFLKPLSIESMVALTLTNFERFLQLFQNKGYEEFCKFYYKYWLHSNQQIRIGSENGELVTVHGLDENGFLSVKREDGEFLSLQPDGNSFDMMSGMIVVKTKR